MCCNIVHNRFSVCVVNRELKLRPQVSWLRPLVSSSRCSDFASMANNSNVVDAQMMPDPDLHAPPDNIPGVVALYTFFVQLMVDAVRGIVVDDVEPSTADCLGFDPVGPVISRRRMQQYTILLGTHSMSNTIDPGHRISVNDLRAARHIMWLNGVVPKALQHAHRHIAFVLEHHRTPEMEDDTGHVNVVKLFMTLLDQTIAELMGNRRMRRIVESTMLEGYPTVHSRHHHGVFGQRAPTLRWYTMTLVVHDPNENV